MKEAVKSNASRYGLIAAAIGIGFSVLAYLIDLELMVNFFIGIARWVVMLVIFIIGVSMVKKQMGGFISFKDAFSTFIIAYVIFALLSTSFNILLFTVVDPAAAEQLTELTIERMVEFQERMGAPDEQIEQSVKMLEEGDQYSVGNQVQGFFWGIVFYAIIGLIVAAIMKKNPPAYNTAEADMANE